MAEDKPAWWIENEKLRKSLALPEYEPPRFRDGTYVHRVVSDVEATLEEPIRFRSAVNPEYPEDWVLFVGDDEVCVVGRHRDERGNTVFELSPEEFRRLLDQHLTTKKQGR